MLLGKNVGLRAIEREDLSQLKNWRNNTEFRKFFREVNELNDFNQNKWFESICSRDSINKMFAIVKLDTNELIGVSGLCYIDWVNRSADFSIYIGYEDLYIDDLYAIETGKVMKDYAFGVLNLHRLWAEIYSIDEKKKVFFDALGFRLDGELKETYWYDNKWHNSLYYSYLSSFDNE